MTKLDPIIRFHRNYVIDVETECWVWQAALNPKGYGVLYTYGKQRPVHRFSWEIYNGEVIPDHLQIDHRCRNTSCVNPNHLDVVTGRENQRRRPVITHCSRGHEFTPENTRFTGPAKPQRVCRKCHLLHNRRHAARTRAARAAA